MCGRYNLIPDPSAWADVGKLLGEEILAALRALEPRYNVSPTQMIPIIVMGADGKPQLIEARWGFIPHYWNKPTPPNLTTNVRSETAAVKPMWKYAWRKQRCLIPASGWYEWFVAEDGSKKPPKVPHHIRRADGQQILFAGVWSVFCSTPESPGLPTCSIVTIPSPPSIAEIHARTPVVMAPDLWLDWLDPAITDAEQVNDMVRMGAAKLFRMHTLGPDVGNSRNQGAQLVEPAEREEMKRQGSLSVDEPLLEWLRHTPADQLRSDIARRLDLQPQPSIAERRLWVREIEDREDAESLTDLMDEIRATLRPVARQTTEPKPQKPLPPQGSLF